jgi:eukaryotic-like serine/threonine-protein kinase
MRRTWVDARPSVDDVYVSMRPQRLGRYELLRHLASGGMAQVYLARATGPGGFARHVVLKTIPAEHRDDERFIAMFLDEARLVATLHHQNIAQVFDVDRAEDGTYFFAMEYVHGETVRHLLQAATDRSVTLPLEVGLSIACAAAAGLHHAHERRGIDGEPLGIVHRDVSPSNLILGYDGSIKLIDFGIAKATLRTTNTVTGYIKGKAGYMAPEQARGYAVDRRADVFSLGVLAYELTTQSRAFHAQSQFETLRRTTHAEVEPPSRRVPGYPAALEDVIMTALELDPDDRFQDTDSMRIAFEQVARELEIVLGDAPVTKALEQLFPRTPEPWLSEPSLDDEPTHVRDDSEPAIVVIPRTPTPQRLARGTADPTPRPAVPALETLDFTTKPFPRKSRPLRAQKSGSAMLPLPPQRTTPTPMPALSAADCTPEPVVAREVTPVPLPRREASALLPVQAAPRASSVLLAVQAPPRSVTTTAQLDIISERHRRVLAILAGSAGVLGVLTIIIVLARSESPSAQPPASAPAAPAIAPKPAPPLPAPPRAETVRRDDGTVLLHVTSDPEGATVVLDGVRLGVTPFAARVPEKDAAWLKVRMKGFAAVKTRVSLDHDVDWNVALRALAQ